MDNKVKVKEIADELGVKPKEVLEICTEFGIDAKTHSSAVKMEDAEKLMHFFMTGERPAGHPSKTSVLVQSENIKAQPRTTDDTHAIAADIPEKQSELKTTEITPVKSPRPGVQPRERKAFEIIKKGPNHRDKPVAQSIYETLEKKDTTAKPVAVAKKPKPTIVATKKLDGIKINIDREFTDKDDDSDTMVMLPDFSVGGRFDEEEEKNAPTKTATAENQKAKSAAKKPQPRLNAQNISRGQRRRKPPKQSQVEKEEINGTIEIEEDIRLYEFAERTGKTIGEVIKAIFNLGLMKTKNDFLDKDIIELLAEEFGLSIEIKNVMEELDYIKEYEAENEELSEGDVRPPIVTIMGHVDHGKTTLLDKIRNAKVALGEAGGITQHIGAYMVEKNGHKITFLDTPGHEAFTHMRARGAQVTDIAIIVVAADDGVMPQTKEAISHVQDAKVPFFIAVNKIDKPNANPDFVKTQLAEMGITPIEWGGEHEFVHISAKSGEGVDTLLDTVLIQAELLELKANAKKSAKAVVVEASLEKGRGAVASMLMQDGTLHVGDNIVVGQHYGKVRAIIDDMGNHITQLLPSEPGQILGLNGVPGAGDVLVAVENEKIAKDYAESIREHQRARELSKTTKATFDDLHSLIKEGKLKRLNIILKADVQGSLEAIRASLEKIKNDEVKVHIVHSAVGGITESDVELAKAGEHESTLIIGFNVKPTAAIKDKADDYGIDIKTYSVIFELIDDIKVAVGDMLSPIKELVSTGKAEVRNLFTVGKNLVIAGCMVTDSVITRDAHVQISRNGDIVFEGKIGSLKRFKDDVKEVKAGLECGIVIDGFNEIQENDVIECFKTVTKAAVFEESEEDAG